MNVEENNTKLTSEMIRSVTKQRETIGRTENKRRTNRSDTNGMMTSRSVYKGQKGFAQR
jgi:hypothetical protein